MRRVTAIMPKSALLHPCRMASNGSSGFGVVERSLFRSLLRLSIKFDQTPASKLLFYRKSISSDISASKESASAYYQNEIIPLLFVGRTQAKLFHPKAQSEINLYSIVRSEFRKFRKEYNMNERTDGGFASVRKLSALWRCYTSMNLSMQETQKFLTSVQKVSGDNFGSSPHASAISNKKLGVAESDTLLPGIILAAHPMIQGPLKRAVILLVEHNTDGSYGIVINRPTNHTLATAVKNLPTHILDGFGGIRVGFGGMVRRLQYLHKFPQIQGMPIPLCGGPFFAGGKIAEATKLVLEQPALKQDFHFFVGCCTWDPEELAQELDTGYWLPINTHADEVVALAKSTDKFDRSDKKQSSSVNGKSRSEERPEHDTVNMQNIPTECEELPLPTALDDGHVDLWSVLVGRLGNAYRPALSLAKWVDASSVESLD